MEISKYLIPAPRSSKLGWYEKLQEQNFLLLLNDLPLSILLIGDPLIPNISRYLDVWSEYFSKHHTLSFGVPGDKIQNLLWRIKNLKLLSLRTGNINIIYSLLESECPKHSLYSYNHKLEWLNADGSLMNHCFIVITYI